MDPLLGSLLSGESAFLPAQRANLPEFLGDYVDEVNSLRAVGRMFHARGWSVGTSSNYSVVSQREPLELLITASGKDKGCLAPGDFVRVDSAGRPVMPGQPKSSAETLLHCLLAQQPQIGAVLHTHSVWSTLLSDLYSDQGGFWIEDYEMLKGFEGVTTHRHRAWVDIFDNSQDIPALVEEIEAKWQGSEAGARRVSIPAHVHGFLLRQHGLYTWGPDLFAARRHVEIFEFLFECVARKLMLQASLVTRG